MKIENKSMLYSEFLFQQNIIKSNCKDFMNSFKDYVYKYRKQYRAELYKNSGNYLYFTSQIDINTKKSVLIVIHELSRTGAPVVAVDTAKILKDSGYFVTVITLKGGKLLEELTEYGIPVVLMNQAKYVQYTGIWIEHFTNYFDMDVFVKSFDHVIMITATLYNLIKRYMNSNKKIIWWIHEGAELYGIIGHKMPKNIMPNIKVFCVGEYSIKQLEKWDLDYHPKVLSYGVNDIGQKEKNKKNDKTFFLSVGTLSTRKGQLLLLEAIKKLTIEEQENVSLFLLVITMSLILLVKK